MTFVTLSPYLSRSTHCRLRRYAHYLATLQRLHVDPRSREILAPIHEPLNRRDEDDDRKGDYAVIHVAAHYRELRREEE